MDKKDKKRQKNEENETKFRKSCVNYGNQLGVFMIVSDE